MKNLINRPEWDRIIREPEEKKITGVSRITRWRWECAGNWPKAVRIGPNSKGHWLSDIMAALEARGANNVTS
jgi:predicted DNA-binding transcriptional regulator AlpA